MTSFRPDNKDDTAERRILESCTGVGADIVALAEQLVNKNCFTKRMMPELAQKSFNQMSKEV